MLVTLLFVLLSALLAALPALLVGSRLGAWAFHRAKPHHHRRIALMILVGLALVLIVRAFAVT